MITYNDLYEFLRKERYSEQLQPLQKKFISEVFEYLSDKRKIAGRKGEMFSEEISKTKKQLENAVAIFKELMLLRKKKLLGLAFVASETGASKRDFDNMLDFERELFDEIMQGVERAEKKLASQMSNNVQLDDVEELKVLLFLEDIEEVIGLDGMPVGPFKKDEISSVPKQIADIFISEKKAEVIID